MSRPYERQQKADWCKHAVKTKIVQKLKSGLSTMEYQSTF